MKREIRFRGKRIDNGEWVYGYLALHDFIADGQTHHEIDPDTVGQFTGLRDIEGVNIYEGDIGRHLNIREDREILWDDGQFCVKSGDDLFRFFSYRAENFTITRNIHDDAELP